MTKNTMNDSKEIKISLVLSARLHAIEDYLTKHDPKARNELKKLFNENWEMIMKEINKRIDDFSYENTHISKQINESNLPESARIYVESLWLRCRKYEEKNKKIYSIITSVKGDLEDISQELIKI